MGRRRTNGAAGGFLTEEDLAACGLERRSMSLFWMRHSLSSRDALPEMTLIARVLEVERIVLEIPNGP
jgi:hypothetical protein